LLVFRRERAKAHRRNTLRRQRRDQAKTKQEQKRTKFHGASKGGLGAMGLKRNPGLKAKAKTRLEAGVDLW
jgi:hypothetical protein